MQPIVKSFLGTIGIPELLIVFGLIVVFFGPKRLPQLGAGLGKGIKNFKSSLTGEDEKQIESDKGDEK
jgi:sec-independent protein translocase protein TatA